MMGFSQRFTKLQFWKPPLGRYRDEFLDRSSSLLVSICIHLALLILLALLTFERSTQSSVLRIAMDKADGSVGPQLRSLEFAETIPVSIGQPKEFEVPVEVFEDRQQPVDVKAILPTPPVEAAVTNVSRALLQPDKAEYLNPTGKTRTSVFGLVGEGSRFVYVFDRSESMNSGVVYYSGDQVTGEQTLLMLAKAELIRSLKELDEQNSFQVIFYNHQPTPFRNPFFRRGALYRASKDVRAEALLAIEEMTGVGKTDHQMALGQAVAMNPDVIFLMTDGEAKDDLTSREVRQIVNLCRRRRIQINIIHFSPNPRTDCSLIDLAKRTDGQHLFIDIQDAISKSL
ncbi:vWA domain-containing protein [Roseiconus lacunae]|uniref:hypothetical protein n=1 Tax=Roseiconus lacunae TaxID=2605694 RepID=UPI0011F3FCE4|nr:hypothetical protein [Roseiconus lacunae]